jgi:hypothetical protein
MRRLTPEHLKSFKEAFRIVRTGKDGDGNRYESYGQLNQAAWIGEHANCLIDEIEKLWEERDEK